MAVGLRVALCLVCWLPYGAVAGGFSGDPPERAPSPHRFLRWTHGDAVAALRGVPSGRTLVGLAVGSSLLLASAFDARVERPAARYGDSPVMHVAERFGNRRVVPALSAVLFGASLLTHDVRFQDASFTALESVIVATAVTNVLKFAFGRARPWQGGPAEFRPFRPGYTSFPSGHATMAFAFLTPWILYYPGAQRYALVALATGTAASRLAYRAHWFTDVVAGSAVGFVTGYLLTRRHRGGRARLHAEAAPGRVAVALRL